MCRPEKALKPVIIDANMQAMANQPRRNGVKHTLYNEAAIRCDQHTNFLVVGGSKLWKWLKHSTFNVYALEIAGIPPTNSLVDEATVSGEIFELTRATQQ